jgi:hypothetical protein
MSYVSLEPVAGTLPAIGVVAIVLLLLITSLSSVEQGLEVVRRDIPVVWDSIRQIKLGPFVRSMLRNLHLVWFQHTEFVSMAQKGRMPKATDRLSVALPLVVSVFINYILIFIFLGDIRPFYIYVSDHYFYSYFILWLGPKICAITISML